MNSLSFDDPSLDVLDPTLSLHDQSDIDTALLNDIDGKKTYHCTVANPVAFIVTVQLLQWR